MIRSVAIHEFKRSLIQKLCVAVPTLLALLIVEPLIGFRSDVMPVIVKNLGGTPDLIIDMLVAVLLVLSGFVSGIATFSRLKEHHLAFVHSLPFPRIEIWASVLVGHICAAVTVVLIALALRPSALRGVDVQALLPAVALYAVLFAAGCCVIMLFRSVFLSAAAGFCIVALGLAMTTVFAFAGNADASAIRIYGIPLEPRFTAFWVVGLFVLACMYLGLSARYFLRGEFDLAKTRIHNWTALGFCFLVYPWILTAGMHSPIVARYDKWEAQPFREAAVSYDGKHLAVIERRSKHGLFTRITTVDLVTGNRLGMYESYGMLFPIWSKTAPVLHVASLQAPAQRLAYALPPSDFILRLSPDCQVLDRVSFAYSQIQEVRPGTDNNLLVLTTDRNEAALFSLDENGRTKELLKTDGGDVATLQSTATSIVLRTYRRLSNYELEVRRQWFVDSSIRESGPAESGAGILLADKWYTPKSITTELNRRFPPENAAVQYLFSGHPYSFTSRYRTFWPRWTYQNIVKLNPDLMFALASDPNADKKRVVMFDRSSGAWQTLGETLPLSMGSSFIRHTNESYAYETTFGIAADHELGLAAFHINRGPTRDSYLYDANLKQRILLTTEKETDRPIVFSAIQKVHGLDGALVLYFRGGEIGAFLYQPGSSIRPVRPPGGTVLYMDAAGNQVYWQYSGAKAFYESAAGERRQVWPVQ